MTMTKAQLLAAVRQVESGGNYSVVNSIGAVGAYQVMKANIPSWTKKALGYSMTWQQFRDSPSAQDKVAEVILGGYYDKYGAAGAASMWFSGQPNPASKASDGSNTVQQYVDKIMAAAGGTGGMVGTSSAVGGGGGAGSTAVTPQLSTDELAAQYGLSAALVNSNKELKSLFSKAVAGSWSADLFTAKLKNTNWWKTQPDTLRQYITDKYTDPATWRQKNLQAISDINALAVQVGLGTQVYSTGKFKGGADPLLQKAVYYSLALGWSDARVKNWLGSQVSGHNGVFYGEAGDTYDKLHSLAYTNGMTYAASWYANQTRNVSGGKSTEEQLEASIRKAAAAKYSAFAPQILAGQNVMDLASPYIQSVAKILEVPDTDVDVFNSHISQAMTSNTKGQAMSIWQFEQSLRQDPLWKKTQNAQDGAMSVAHQVLQNFGLAF